VVEVVPAARRSPHRTDLLAATQNHGRINPSPDPRRGAPTTARAVGNRLPHGSLLKSSRRPALFPRELDLRPRPTVEVGRIRTSAREPGWPQRQPTRSIGMEFFGFEGDALWNTTPTNLVKSRPPPKIHISASAREGEDRVLVRVHNSPMYTPSTPAVQTIRGGLDDPEPIQAPQRTSPLQHSDHSMLNREGGQSRTSSRQPTHSGRSNPRACTNENVKRSSPHINAPDTPRIENRSRMAVVLPCNSCLDSWG